MKHYVRLDFLQILVSLATTKEKLHCLYRIATITCNSVPSTIAGQWYCTPIGNIADEGQSGVLSSDQEGVADSLMSKLGITDETTTNTSESKTRTGSDESTDVGASFSVTNP
jgi:hypothetical protein